MNSQREISKKEKEDEEQKNRREDFLRPIDSLHENFKQLKLTSSSALPSPPNVESPLRQDTICRWITDILSQNPAVSDFALQNLAKHNGLEILPLLLWVSPCTVTKLLQEVVKTYGHIVGHIVGHIAIPFLPQLNIDRVYNVLLLFQCVARNPETRLKFLKANMPHYFYPLMGIGDLTDKPHERLRFGALCVIAYLLKPINGAGIQFLMDTDAFHHCIKPIEFGSISSKTVAVSILHKIMSTNEGLQYFCEFADRFFIIDGLLKKLLLYLSSMTEPSPILLKLVYDCYFKISQNSRALEELRRDIPLLLFDGTFSSLFAEDSETDYCRMQLSQKLGYKTMK